MAATVEVGEKLFTVAEWLDFEKTAEVRHEYYFGKLIPMSGEAKRANRIANNLLKLMDEHLYALGYEMYDHDIKTEVLPNGIYRYPDLVVAPIVDDEHDYIVKQPVLMVEVVSEGSGLRDRVKKRKEYFQIPSLWYYLVVDQDEMLVELHSRDADGPWTTQYFTEPDDSILLSRFDLKFNVRDIYQRLKMQL